MDRTWSLSDLAHKDGAGAPPDEAVADRVPSPAALLAAAALAEALGPRGMKRLANPKETLCICVAVPDESWEQPLREALRRLGRPIQVFFRNATAKRAIDAVTIQDLLDCLARERSVVCLSQDLQAGFPQALRTAADLVLKVSEPAPRLVATAIALHSGSRGPRSVPPDLGRGLNLQELAACLRPGERPWRSVDRIQRAQASKTAISVDVLAPHLQDLAGYGMAAEWGQRLLNDVSAYRNGLLPWADLDAQAVLHGPPGTGKSLFARALARSTNLPLVVTGVGQWFRSYTGDLGGTIKAVAAVFDEAKLAVRTHGGAVLFIDEIDGLPDRAALDADRGSWWRPVVNYVLTTLDGAGTDLAGMVLLAATNDLRAVDPALLRPGRLGTHLAILPPDLENLARITAHHLGGKACPISLPELIEALRPLEGGTQATAAAWARAARARARAQNRAVSVADITASTMPKCGASDETYRRVALHEAGHAVVGAFIAPERLVSTSIVETAQTGGVTLFLTDRGSLRTKDEMEAGIIILLAGRAADVVLGAGATMGAGAVGPMGAVSDLGQATNRLTEIHAALGLGATLRYRGDPERSYLLASDRQLQEIVEADLQRLMARAENLVRERAHAVRAVADALLQRRFLTGQVVRDMIDATERAALRSDQVTRTGLGCLVAPRSTRERA